MKQNNPWKGLDSYNETDRLYGRDEEIEVLFSRIEYNVQTVVYSSSGIGKSSLIRAGIFPKARQAGMLPVSIRLQHSASKNEHHTPYIDQVKNAVDEQLSQHNGWKEEVMPHKNDHEETLWEYLHRFRFYVDTDGNRKQVTPLLVFDQFEEIFTLEKNIKRIIGFFSQVADLLNGVMPEYLAEEQQADVIQTEERSRVNIFKSIKDRTRTNDAEYLQEDNFRVLFSLREDYLSYLERYTTRIPSLKMNRYCLLPITEEQAATIIMEPRPGLVSLEVAKLIIEKITGESNFKLDGHPEIFVDSAILSLYLSRLYDRMPEEENEITAELVGKLSDDIIENFYEEAIKDIPPSSVEYLEDNLLNNEGRRENVSVYNATHIGGLSDDDLDKLSENRRLIRRFAYGGVMRIEFIHDILCAVVMTRRSIRNIMKLQQEERRKLLEQERIKRHELMEKAKADKQRYRLWMTIGAMVFFIVAVKWLYHQYMNNWTCSKYYSSYIFVKGWPVGVGEELTENKARQLAVCFKLTKKGHRADIPFKSIEVMSPDDKILHNNKFIPLVDKTEETDKNAKQFVSMLNRTKYMKFSSNETGDTAYATRYEALDQDGHVLYVVSYFKSIDEQHNEDLTSDESYLWAIYTDAKGAPLPVRDNGADRMQVFLNELGQEEKYMFYDGNRAPRQNSLGNYGFRVHYDKLNRIDTMWVVDPFSEELFKEVINYAPQSENYRCFDLHGNPIKHPTLKYHRRFVKMDTRGNIIRKYYYEPDGRYVDERVRSAIVHLQYDKLNRLVITDDYDGEGKPYTQNRKYYPHREFQYIRNTANKRLERDYRWDTSQQKMVEVRRFEIRLFGSVYETVTENIELNQYNMVRVENDEDEQPVSFSYYDRDDNPVFDSIENYYKHIIERKKLPDGKTVVVHKFFDVDGSLYSEPGRRDYAIDSCVYSSRNQLLSQICFNRNYEILKSQAYEYKDGVEVARYVLGVKGTPIRCPKWERDGLCYYKLMSVHSGKDVFSYVHPVNEYGCNSWAYDGSDPSGITERREQNLTIDMLGSNWRKETVTNIYADHIPDDAFAVVYVHLLKPNSVAERFGLNDGDLLLEAGNWKYTPQLSMPVVLKEWESLGSRPKSIKIARYDANRRSWRVLTLNINQFKEELGCEVYPVFYTNEEYSEFKKVLTL